MKMSWLNIIGNFAGIVSLIWLILEKAWRRMYKPSLVIGPIQSRPSEGHPACTDWWLPIKSQAPKGWVGRIIGKDEVRIRASIQCYHEQKEVMPLSDVEWDTDTESGQVLLAPGSQVGLVFIGLGSKDGFIIKGATRGATEMIYHMNSLGKYELNISIKPLNMRETKVKITITLDRLNLIVNQID
jgi:hypothetical protein